MITTSESKNSIVFSLAIFFGAEGPQDGSRGQRGRGTRAKNKGRGPRVVTLVCFPPLENFFWSSENISELEKINFLVRGKFSEMGSGLKRCYLLVVRHSVAEWISTIKYCISKTMTTTVKSSLSK